MTKLMKGETAAMMLENPFNFQGFVWDGNKERLLSPL